MEVERHRAELKVARGRLDVIKASLRQQREAIKRQSREIEQLQTIVAQLIRRGRIPESELESHQEE